jgi:hypothetical protein
MSRADRARRSPSSFLSSRRVGNRRNALRSPRSVHVMLAFLAVRLRAPAVPDKPISPADRPLVPYRAGGGFIGASLDHAGQPPVPADRGDVARVCSSRSEHEPALPEPVDHARGGAGHEAGRWCSWPTRSGSAREAQSRVAADRAVRPRRRVRGRKLAGCVQSCLRSREAASAGQGGFARGS